MPLKLSIGVSRKVGLPAYSSRGAHCALEIEVESSLLRDRPDEFQQQVDSAYACCRKAVDEELARNAVSDDAHGAPDATVNIQSTRENHNGNGRHVNGTANRPATDRQLNYIRGLVGQIDGPAPRSIEDVSARILGKDADELTSRDASELIRRLRDMRDGIIDLTAIAETPAA